MVSLRALWAALRQQPAPASSQEPAYDRDGRHHHLVLYKSDACPYCQRVLAFLRQHPIPIVYKDILQTPAFREELVAFGGKGQVPCLSIDGEPLYESSDILAYLQTYTKA